MNKVYPILAIILPVGNEAGPEESIAEAEIGFGREFDVRHLPRDDGNLSPGREDGTGVVGHRLPRPCKRGDNEPAAESLWGLHPHQAATGHLLRTEEAVRIGVAHRICSRDDWNARPVLGGALDHPGDQSWARERAGSVVDQHKLTVHCLDTGPGRVLPPLPSGDDPSADSKPFSDPRCGRLFPSRTTITISCTAGTHANAVNE